MMNLIDLNIFGCFYFKNEFFSKLNLKDKYKQNIKENLFQESNSRFFTISISTNPHDSLYSLLSYFSNE